MVALNKNDIDVNEYISVRSSDRQEMARDCLKWRLYSPGGWLRHEYIAIRDNVKKKSRRRFLILYIRKVPAAVIMGSNNCIMVYVPPVFRRSGFATYLINHYIRRYRLKRSDLRATPGTRGSGQLYFSCGIQKTSSHTEFYGTFD